MTTEQELNALRDKFAPKEEASASLSEMNDLAEQIARLRDQEKELSDAKKKITDQLEIAENTAMELMVQAGLTTYKAPAATMSLSHRTSVKQPQGANIQEWLGYLVKRCGSLEAAIQEGLLSTNSMKLNSLYKEELELSRERGEDSFQIPGLTEVKVLPSLMFRRTR